MFSVCRHAGSLCTSNDISPREGLSYASENVAGQAGAAAGAEGCTVTGDGGVGSNGGDDDGGDDDSRPRRRGSLFDIIAESYSK